MVEQDGFQLQGLKKMDGKAAKAVLFGAKRVELKFYAVEEINDGGVFVDEGCRLLSFGEPGNDRVDGFCRAWGGF